MFSGLDGAAWSPTFVTISLPEVSSPDVWLAPLHQASFTEGQEEASGTATWRPTNSPVASSRSWATALNLPVPNRSCHYQALPHSLCPTYDLTPFATGIIIMLLQEIR